MSKVGAVRSLEYGSESRGERIDAPLVQRLQYAADGLLMAEIGDTCVAIWRVRPTPFLFDLQANALEEAIHRNPDPIGFLCIVEETARPPSDEVRKASVAMLVSQRAHLACVAGVVVGCGFGAAIVRSVLAGMAFMLKRHDFPFIFTDTPEHAVNWMSRYLALGTPASFCSALEAYRASLLNSSNISTR